VGTGGAEIDHLGMDTTLPARSPWRIALRPLITTRGWTAVTHHLLALPLGIAYFTWFVTGLLTGVGLLVTIVGIPILTGVLASVRPLLAAERTMANALLGADIPSARLAPDGEGWFGRLKAYWTDEPTWRGLGYLVARLPVGLVTFTVVVGFFSTALWLIAAPLLAPLDAIDFGFWEPDTVLEGIALAPLGLMLLVASGWVSAGLAAMSRSLARWGAR
jgi:putative sensor protein